MPSAWCYPNGNAQVIILLLKAHVVVVKHYLLNGCYSVRIRRNSALDEVSDLSEGCLFDRWACEGTSVTRERVEPFPCVSHRTFANPGGVTVAGGNPE